MSILYNDDVELDSTASRQGSDNTTSISDSSTQGQTPSLDPISVVDNTNRPIDGWIGDTGSSGGTSGEIYIDIAPTEKSPLPEQTYHTINQKVRETIHDFSQAYLESLADSGVKFYAIYSDGTEDEVEYTEIYDPHQIDTTIYTNEAYAIANAINQHFWDDTNGIHVTDVSQEDWETAVAASFSDLSSNKQYHNILINSLGMLLRSALNNLISLSRSGMTVYDGLGNDISNVLASFAGNGASFRENGKTRATVTTQGLTIYDDSGSVSNGSETFGSQVAFIGIDASGKPYSRIGKSVKGYIEIGVNANDNGYIDFYNGSTILAHIGYDIGNNSSGNSENAPYYTFGKRSVALTTSTWSSSMSYYNPGSVVIYNNWYFICIQYHVPSSSITPPSSPYMGAANEYWCAITPTGRMIGSRSTVLGESDTAFGSASLSSGYATAASTFAFSTGAFTYALGQASVSEGRDTVAIGVNSHASGNGTVAAYNNQFVCGKYNRLNSAYFVVGSGTSARQSKNALSIFSSSAYFAGTTSSDGTQITSDARIKTLIEFLSPEESMDFIKFLIPKMYNKNGKKDLGFYAQEIEKHPKYGTILVAKDNSGEYDLPDFRILNYNGLLAPIVSALQGTISKTEELENKIEQLEKENSDLRHKNQQLEDRLARIEAALGL